MSYYEQATRGSSRERKAYFDFLTAWKAAGFPKNFRWSQDQGRILDKAALRERLDDQLHPERKRERIQRYELRYRRKLLDLNYR